MIKDYKAFKDIINKFSEFQQVEAITLAGSNSFETEDENSDIDIDVYINAEIPVSKREAIAKEFSEHIEINNQFWGPGDEWELTDCKIVVDIIYLDMKWIKEYLERVVDRYEASVGYTTCFWHNIAYSKIMFDRNGKLEEIQKKYKVKYPQKLKQNIIDKNYPILRKNISSYYYQIEKAIKRGDLVSINHRVAAFLASYFDILFAINEVAHPGEKKLIKIIKSKCRKIPLDMEKNIVTILNKSQGANKEILSEINELIDNLDDLLSMENLKFNI